MAESKLRSAPGDQVADHLGDQAVLFSQLFEQLSRAGYYGQPLTPEQMQKRRALDEDSGALIHYFHLGLDVPPSALESAGLSPDLVEPITRQKPAVSRVGQRFFAHNHWPPEWGDEKNFVYLGRESLMLEQRLQPYRHLLSHSFVLDLGSGAGVLSVAASDAGAARVVAIEPSERAIQWSRATIGAYHINNIHFYRGAVGSPETESYVTQQGPAWDVALFNPPMAVSNPLSARPHRDGGFRGIELPLMFLDFSARHLKVGGHVIALMTNPITPQGEGLLFQQLRARRQWVILERECIEDDFNRSLYRKEGYEQRGIARVELWFLVLRLK